MKLTVYEYEGNWYLYDSKSDTFWATQFSKSTMMGCTVTDDHKITELRKLIATKVVDALIIQGEPSLTK